MKIVRLIMALTIAITILPYPAQANSPPTIDTVSITPLYSYFSSGTCTLSFSGKTAHIAAKASGHPGVTTSLRAAISLQRWDGAAWVTIFSDSIRGTKSLSYTKSVSTARSGQYRLRTVITANNKETVTFYGYASR